MLLDQTVTCHATPNDGGFVDVLPCGSALFVTTAGLLFAMAVHMPSQHMSANDRES